MQALLDVILPVFLVIGFGYVTVWRGLFNETTIDGLMRFVMHFAIPCLLFRSISTLDLGQSFHLPLLISFYTGATAGFLTGLLGARYLFGRGWEDAVAIGFCCLFSNTVLLGLPITERAWGIDALGDSFAIVAMHAIYCYGLGVTVMEFVRNRGKRVMATLGVVARAMFRNALVIAIVLGFIVNLTGVALPGALAQALDLIARAALPAALFGLGGVLVRYRPEGDMRVILWVCFVSLIIHPLIVWGMGRAFELGEQSFRSAVLMAAMAPGINTYVFASLYGRATRVAASTVLFATAFSLFTAWGWLTVLGG